MLFFGLCYMIIFNMDTAPNCRVNYSNPKTTDWLRHSNQVSRKIELLNEELNQTITNI